MEFTQKSNESYISKIYLREGVNNQIKKTLQEIFNSENNETKIIFLRDSIFNDYDLITASYTGQRGNEDSFLLNEQYERRESWLDIKGNIENISALHSFQIDDRTDTLYTDADYKILINSDPNAYFNFQYYIDNLYIVDSVEQAIEIIN